MYRQTRGYYIARFGTLQTVPIQANTDYTASVWTRQFDMDGQDGVCTVQFYIDENGNNGIDSTGTAQGGFGISQQTIRPSPGPWKKTEWTFNTRRFTTAVFAFFIECSCPNTGDCPTGPIGVGIDDMELKPASTWCLKASSLRWLGFSMIVTVLGLPLQFVLQVVQNFLIQLSIYNIILLRFLANSSLLSRN